MKLALPDAQKCLSGCTDMRSPLGLLFCCRFLSSAEILPVSNSAATRSMSVKHICARILQSPPQTLEPGLQSSWSSCIKHQFNFPFFINSSFSRDVLATFCSRSTFIISFSFSFTSFYIPFPPIC